MGLMNLWKCIYEKRDHLIIVLDLVTLLLKSYDVLYVFNNEGQTEHWERTKKDLIGYFNTTFLQVAPVIKNSHYREEKEWRLITTPIRNADENYFAQITNRRILEYYSFNFDLIDNGKYEFLQEVVIGPTKEPRLTAYAFDVLLHKNGYKFKGIANSQIPYRFGI